MFNLQCEGENVCVTGDFDCENCSHGMRGNNKPQKAPTKKPKMKTAPPKQFKRRKK